MLARLVSVLPGSPRPAVHPNPAVVLLRSARVVASVLAGVWLLAPHQLLEAQQASANPAAWLTYSGDFGVSERQALLLDLQGRFLELPTAPTQLLLHAGIASRVGSAVRLAGGYGFRGTQVDGASAGTYLPEHRLWQSIQLTNRIGRTNVAHRLRLEERRMRVSEAPGAGSESSSRWVTAYRVRYQLRGTLPITHAAPESRVYGTAANELFAVGGGLEPSFALDQNRAAIGVGILATPGLRIELGYLNQSTITRGLRFAVRTHALQVTVLSTTARPRREAAPRR